MGFASGAVAGGASSYRTAKSQGINPFSGKNIKQTVLEKDPLRLLELEINAAKTSKSFFEGTEYTNKVLGQMRKGDFHGFPESVKTFESNGVITTIKGGDGVTRQMLKIPGEYGGKKGFFEFIKEANGTINHRLFRPNP